jgi:translation initiation factor eIF-2B subunit delta
MHKSKFGTSLTFKEQAKACGTISSTHPVVNEFAYRI